MCWVTEPRVGGGTSKKVFFLKYLLTEQHNKSGKNQAESFDFSTIYQKIRIEKAQRSTILEGGVHSYPPPHLVVKIIKMWFGDSNIRERSSNLEFECSNSKSNIRPGRFANVRMRIFANPGRTFGFSSTDARFCGIRYTNGMLCAVGRGWSQSSCELKRAFDVSGSQTTLISWVLISSTVLFEMLGVQDCDISMHVRW